MEYRRAERRDQRIFERPGIFHRVGEICVVLSVLIAAVVVVGNDRQL